MRKKLNIKLDNFVTVKHYGYVDYDFSCEYLYVTASVSFVGDGKIKNWSEYIEILKEALKLSINSIHTKDIQTKITTFADLIQKQIAPIKGHK